MSKQPMTELKLSKEDRAIKKQQDAEMKEAHQWQRKNERERKEYEKKLRFELKREMKVLKFMEKNDVLYHHHGTTDSLKKKIEEQIIQLKETSDSSIYDPYIWNRQGEGNNKMPRCVLGYIFSSNEFESIYDVPLDGTYKFHAYDSGERGLGSFHRITATKIESEIIIPKVNPGAFPPITSL